MMTRSRIKIETDDKIPTETLEQIIHSANGVGRIHTIKQTPTAIYAIVDASPAAVNLTAIRNASSEFTIKTVWIRRHFAEDTITA